MTIIKRVWFLLLILFTSTSGQSSVFYACSSYNQCYKYFKFTVTFLEAEQQCNYVGGHLASIHSAEEADFMSKFILAIQVTQLNAAWIGFNNISSTEWHWIDGSPVNYSNIQPYPTGNCIMLDPVGGPWYSYKCETSAPFICSFPFSNTNCATTQLPTSHPLTPLSCDLGWTYYAPTNYCYKVFHNAQWEDAESNCLIYGSHLVSIHSDLENTFVNDLASTGLNGNDVGTMAWIGMHKIDGNWVWTDGTKTDYINWAPKKPDYLVQNVCIQTSPDVTIDFWYKQWNNQDCKLNNRAYICKKAPNYS